MSTDDKTNSPSAELPELIHPVYLDVPMMISFVAALEGGVAFAHESTQTQARSSDSTRDASARVGIPLLSSLLSLDMSGRVGSKAEEQASEEIKVVRRHTEASLFNLLRHRLNADARVAKVSARADLASLQPGQIIEISGQVTANPLEQLFALMSKVIPYLGLDEGALRNPKKKSNPKAPKRSGNPARRTATEQEEKDVDASMEDVLRLLFIMKDDLEVSEVRDAVLSGPDSITAVLTLATEFFTDRSLDYVLGGRFSVLGKVTCVIDDDETINLTRRTALGVAGPDMARSIVEAFTEDNELFVELADPVVESPALQVLPLAVFV